MKQSDKDLLLKDLCARLPYGVICQMEDNLIINDSPFYDYKLSAKHLDLFQNHLNFYIKPYLRPLSSMTEEEEIYYNTVFTILKYWEKEDWLNEHHFDYRGLIEEGLAIEAPKGMYKGE